MMPKCYRPRQWVWGVEYAVNLSLLSVILLGVTPFLFLTSFVSVI